MSSAATVIGAIGAVCTTAANLPQVMKAWRSGQTDDLSLKMLSLLASGLSLWVIYGVMQPDIVIALANGVSLLLISVLIYLKVMQRPS